VHTNIYTYLVITTQGEFQTMLFNGTTIALLFSDSIDRYFNGHSKDAVLPFLFPRFFPRKF